MSSIQTYEISFLSRLEEQHRFYRFYNYSDLKLLIYTRKRSSLSRTRDEFYSYPLLMAHGLPCLLRVHRSYPQAYTRAHRPRMCTAVYATIQTQPCPVSPVSDVAILTDPSRRYSEIYGDATVRTWDWDRVWRAWEEVRKRTKRGSNDQKTESVFRVRERGCIYLHMWGAAERKRKKYLFRMREKKEDQSWDRKKYCIEEAREKTRREKGKENSSWRPWWSR